jgi:hypothetical protein
MPRTANVYAPPAYNGLQDGSPPGYSDVGFDYVYNISLSANQSLVDQQPIANDADFAWRAIYISSNTGSFAVRFSDSQWYWLSSARILNTNLPGDAAAPFPVFPELLLPAGGRIGIDLLDLSGAPNTIQIVFRGVKRYRVAGL